MRRCLSMPRLNKSQKKNILDIIDLLMRRGVTSVRNLQKELKGNYDIDLSVPIVWRYKNDALNINREQRRRTNPKQQDTNAPLSPIHDKGIKGATERTVDKPKEEKCSGCGKHTFKIPSLEEVMEKKKNKHNYW